MKWIILLVVPFLLGQTIAEKKANINKGKSDLPYELDVKLDQLNAAKGAKEDEIRRLYQRGGELYENGAPKEAYEIILADIRKSKRELDDIEMGWQQKASKVLDPEPYGLFHQPETTIEQLVIDYGSQDFVYLIPKEVGSIPISLSSRLPVPRSGWNEMVELILNQSGVVVTSLNPYLRKLSLAKDDFSRIRRIVTDRNMLSFVPREDRILFLISPDPLELKRAELFLDKFSNKATQQVVPLGRQIAIVATRGEVDELLRLYDFLQKESGSKEFSLVTLQRVSGEEMAKMLSVLFDEGGDEKGEGSFSRVNALRILVSKANPRNLFLVGSREEVKRAEDIIRKVEGQMGDFREKVLHWYCARYADPEELADITARIYELLLNRMPIDPCCENGGSNTDVNVTLNDSPFPTPDQFYADSFYQAGSVVVDPAPIELGPSRPRPSPNGNRNNFLVDPKTGAIVMVVEAELLAQVKETLRRLDVPKKMVEIEVLLFEKRTNDRDKFGLNKLDIGNPRVTQNIAQLAWNACPGILDFIFKQVGNAHSPSIDLLYTFLISQKDIEINTSTTALTLNQTPVSLAVVDEISISTGIFEVPQAGGGVALKDSFTREQYGVVLDITPTINPGTGEDDDSAMITLETSVSFDTIHPILHEMGHNRPDITRRKIESQAVVADGESVILGGLRKKQDTTQVEKIPFLGEIPYIGKFFSFTSQEEATTEMFIVITPKIVRDPLYELEWIKHEEMCRRPGDLPDYLCRLNEARCRERHSLFKGTIDMIAGFPPSRCYAPGWQRDGNGD